MQALSRRRVEDEHQFLNVALFTLSLEQVPLSLQGQLNN